MADSGRIFDDAALRAQVQRLDDLDALPKDEAHVGIVAQNGDVGVEGSAHHEIGKGAYVEAQGSWFIRTGYRVAALIGWKKS